MRAFRQQVDEGILDRAAGLFAQRGFAKTSVQDVADAVGLSKAGLLHHFPSKDALRTAVLAHADRVGGRVLDQVRDVPPGPVRDRRLVEAVVDGAFAHPGLVALLLAPPELVGSDPDDPASAAAADAVLLAFGVDGDAPDAERRVRVLGALAALAVLTLTAHAEDRTSAWRPLIVDTCLDALDTPRADSPPLPHHPHPEA